MNNDDLKIEIDKILDNIFNGEKDEEYENIKPTPNPIDFKLKHINDLKIGDEVVIEIPSICFYIGKVSFINKELNFIFLDGNTDEDDEDEIGINFIPNHDGYFKVPNYI